MYIFMQWKEVYDKELAHLIMTLASPKMCGRVTGWRLRGADVSA